MAFAGTAARPTPSDAIDAQQQCAGRIVAERADQDDVETSTRQAHREVRPLAARADAHARRHVGTRPHRPRGNGRDVEEGVAHDGDRGHRGRRVENPSRVLCQ